MRRLGFAVLLAACSHAAPAPENAAPRGPAIACAKVAEHLVSLVAADNHPPQDAVDKLVGVVNQSCEQTHWSEDAKQCTLDAKSHDDVHANCEAKLTQAQGDDLQQRMIAAFPHPPDEAPQGSATP